VQKEKDRPNRAKPTKRKLKKVKDEKITSYISISLK